MYADSAYASAKTTAWLEENAIENGVLDRACRNRPLTAEQKHRTRGLSRIRCTVECVSGVMKLHSGMGRARYFGLARNIMRMALICMSCNIRRGVSLQRKIENLQERYA